MKVRFVFILLVCLSISVRSQGLWKHVVGHPDSVIQKYDTTNVKPLLKQLTLRYFLNVKQTEISVSPSGQDATYRYRAGNFMRYGVGFGYRWLILNYSYGIDPRKKNESGIKSSDLQMNIFGKTLLYDLRAQWYRGFEIDNKYRPDIDLVAFGGSLRYNFNNRKYSFKNTYDQTQWQVKSAGAPIAGFDVGYTRLSADSTIFFGSNAEFNSTFHENYNISFGGGYSYTYVYKRHWFLTTTLTLYLNNSFYGSKSNFTNPDNINLNIIAEPRFGLGYNSHKYYFGVQGTLHELPGKLSDNLPYKYKYNNLKLLFIHRLNFNPFRNKKREANASPPYFVR